MASFLFSLILVATYNSVVSAWSAVPETSPTYNATANNTTSVTTRGAGQPFELYVMIRVVAVVLLCCSGALVTGLGYRERQRIAEAQSKREQLIQLFVVKLDAYDTKLLGLAGYCVETGKVCEPAPTAATDDKATSSDLTKFAVIRRCRKKNDRDALIREARSRAGTCSGCELDIAIPPLPEFRLRIVHDSGQCDVCADAAAKDIVNLGGCTHTLCSSCASRVKCCPFCRGPLVDAATGALSEQETAKERQLLQAQGSQGSSATVIVSVQPAVDSPAPRVVMSGQGTAGATHAAGSQAARAGRREDESVLHVRELPV